MRRWQAPFALAAVLVVAVSLHWADPSDGEKETSPGTRSQPLAQYQRFPPHRDAAPADVPPARSEDLAERSEQSQRRLAPRHVPQNVPAPESAASSRAREAEGLGRGPAPMQPASPPAVFHEPTQLPPSEVGETSASYADSPRSPQPAAPARTRAGASSAEIGAEAAKVKEGLRAGRASADADRDRTASKSASAAVDSVRARSEAQSVPPIARAENVPNGVRKAEIERRADNAAVGTGASPHSRPEQWLRDIEDLYRQGRSAEAQEQLTAFRKRFPDHELPPSLRER